MVVSAARSRVRAWALDDRQRVVLAGALLVLAATLVRAVLLGRTWYYFDDLIQLAQAAHAPLSLSFVMEPYFGHIMPVPRLLAWMATRDELGPYWVFAAQLVVLFATAGAGMLRLLVTLFGARWAILAPLTLFLFSPLLIPAMTWWAAGINHLPALISITWGLHFHVRYLRTRRLRFAWATTGCLAFGLLFAELALLTMAFVAVVSFAHFATGSATQRVTMLWRTYYPAVLLYGVVALGYLLLYGNNLAEQPNALEGVRFRDFATSMIGLAFGSSVVGGPLRWTVRWAAQIEATPGLLMAFVGWATLVGVVLAAEGSRRRSLRAWALLGTMLVVSLGLVVTGRALFGPNIGLDFRFLTEVAPAFALSVALAFLPVREAPEPLEVLRRHRVLDSWRPVLVACAAFGVVATASAAAYPLRHLGDHSAERWFDGLRESASGATPPIQLAETVVPDWIVGPPTSFYSNLYPLFPGPFEVPEVATDDVYVIDDRGSLVPAELDPVRTSRPPASGGSCHWALPPGVTVPLDGPVIGFGWHLQILYSSASDASGAVVIGDRRVPVAFPAGRHTLLMRADGEYDAIEVTLDEGETPSVLCLQELTVGTITAPVS
jgi:hypothetical protein